MNTPDQNTTGKGNFLESGLIIDDKFRIIEPVRKTSGCIVYHATNLEQDTERALLIIPAMIQSDFEAMDILKENARVLKWLNHEYIARFYGLHTRGVYNYFEMEFVHGKSIKRKKYENREKHFSENMARWIALQVLEGLDYAHNQNLLHRNLKPQKIIFTGQGQVRLIDFGVSEAVRNAMALVRDTTSRSAILFMPPEQIRGKQLSVQSDIYSLGATLYYLLDQKPPFFQGDIHYQILNELPEPIEGVSKELNDIILKCLAKDISQRFQSCAEMITAIRANTKIPEIKRTITEPPVINEKINVPSAPITFSDDITFDNQESFFDVIIEKMKTHKSNLIWIGAFFILVISVISIKVVFNSHNGKEGTTYSAADNRDPQTKKRMIAALNTAADKQYKAGRFISPKGNNALDLYLEVLKIDSNEQHAAEQIESMKQKLYNEVKNYLSDWMLLEASDLLDDCLSYFSNEERFTKLQGELNELLKNPESLPIHIEILNGAGKSGIANTLSKKLKENKFKVVNSDNYRVNGRVNWQVRNTLFIGSLPQNKRLKKLEALLNLDYKQEKLTRKQSKSSNVIIVLGADYTKIPALKK